MTKQHLTETEILELRVKLNGVKFAMSSLETQLNVSDPKLLNISESTQSIILLTSSSQQLAEKYASITNPIRTTLK